jgi:hypothetical protein
VTLSRYELDDVRTFAGVTLQHRFADSPSAGVIVQITHESPLADDDEGNRRRLDGKSDDDPRKQRLVFRVLGDLVPMQLRARLGHDQSFEEALRSAAVGTPFAPEQVDGDRLGQIIDFTGSVGCDCDRYGKGGEDDAQSLVRPEGAKVALQKPDKTADLHV